MSDDNGQQTYLAFRWTTAGYELSEESGRLPEVGSTVETDGKSWTVYKVAPSPLPNDRRSCAYLQS
jgi:hypothetical protein